MRTWITFTNIPDIGIEYIMCAALALSFFVIIVRSGRRLGRSKGFEKYITQLLAQEGTWVATALLQFGLSKVRNVKATGPYAYACSYQCYRSCSSSTNGHHWHHPQSSCRFPARWMFLNRRHCMMLALICSSNASRMEAFTASTAVARKGLVTAKFDTDSFTLG